MFMRFSIATLLLSFLSFAHADSYMSLEDVQLIAEREANGCVYETLDYVEAMLQANHPELDAQAWCDSVDDQGSIDVCEEIMPCYE